MSIGSLLHLNITLHPSSSIPVLIMSKRVMTVRCECRREQQRWVAERLENRQSLSTAQSLRTLRTLVHADEFEAFLAEHFPYSKGDVCVNMSVGLHDAYTATLDTQYLLGHCG